LASWRAVGGVRGRRASLAAADGANLLSFRFEPPRVDHPHRGGNARSRVSVLPKSSHNAAVVCQSRVHCVLVPSAASTMTELLDPETVVDWAKVALVGLRFEKSAEATCPVSLDPLEAPLVGRCGHAFSAISILSALQLQSQADRPTGRCPVCSDAINPMDLRPAVFSISSPPQVGNEAHFTLLFKVELCDFKDFAVKVPLTE
jgi:hypothetical protein